MTMRGSSNNGLILPDGRMVDFTHPRMMGILNVTPDSFSDGGRYEVPEQAIAQARLMLEQGADVIDIGGESTRPGAERVSAAQQINRVLPIIQRLKAEWNPVISIDTTSAEVAAAALEAGASIINDVSAGEEDAEMLALAGEAKAPIVLMHKKGQPANMQENPQYENVVGEVLAYLLKRAALAKEAGVEAHNIILDPGIGFGKTTGHNLELMKGLGRLVETGYPVLLGASRKRFIGELSRVASVVDDKPSVEIPAEERVAGTVATTVMGVQAGVQMFRVHDVLPNKQAATFVHSLLQHSGEQP